MYKKSRLINNMFEPFLGRLKAEVDLGAYLDLEERKLFTRKTLAATIARIHQDF